MKTEDGTENCTASLEYSETNLQNIYSILVLLPWDHATQEMVIMFLGSKENILFPEIFFSPL